MLHAQRWEHTIGLPYRNEIGGKIMEHYDHGYLIAGYTGTGSGDSQGWFVKTDINGQLLWDKQIISTSPNQVGIMKLLYDQNGNIYVFGFLWQNQPHEFPVIVKLNACGEKLWCRTFVLEGYNFGVFNDAMFTENGDLLCLAYMPEDDLSNDNRILLFRVSSEGELLWHKGYATHKDHPHYGDPTGMAINQFGDQYIITGSLHSPYPEDPNQNHVWLRPMFIGISADFEEQWIVEFGIADSMLGKAHSVVAINDTLFMGLGRHRFIENGIQDQNSWLMFFNHNGKQVGSHIIEDEQIGPEIVESIIPYAEQIDGDKYLATAGYMYNEDKLNWGEMVIDTAGNVYNYAIRENTVPGADSFIAKTFDNKYAFSASYELPSQAYADIYHYKLNENLEYDTLYPGTYNYDSLCDDLPIVSGKIDLAECDITISIDEIPSLEQYRKKLQGITITASPNPSNTGEVLLEYENTKSFTQLELLVSNVYGKLIYREAILSRQGATRLYTDTWPAGLYVAVVYANGNTRGKVKFVVQ
jgi:hypothetical protein